MDNLALQIKLICLVSILTGVLSTLLPSGRLKKSFNSFCAIIIVFVIMLPFSTLGRSAQKESFLDFDEREGDLLSQSDTAEKLIYTSVLENALNDRFYEMGFSATVKAECEKLGESYTVVSFTVKSAEENEKEKIYSYLNEGFGGVAVYFEEEKDG